MVITLERDLLKLTAITEEFLEDMDTVVMVITLARDLPKLTAITEEFSGDMDMAATVTILERDLLIATMEEFLEDTDMVDTSRLPIRCPAYGYPAYPYPAYPTWATG